MKREYIVASVFLALFCAMAFVSAIGSSTGSNRQPDSAQTDSALNAVNAAACETRTVLKDRIQCRMQARSNVKSIEEACRALPLDKQNACTRMQNNAAPCYDKSSQEKAACLRTHAGLGTGQLNRFAAEDRRKYAALLLYELQERVEEKQEAGALTEEQAADLIAQIVEIKQLLLNNAPIADVRAQMTSFKTAYTEAMGGRA